MYTSELQVGCEQLIPTCAATPSQWYVVAWMTFIRTIEIHASGIPLEWREGEKGKFTPRSVLHGNISMGESEYVLWMASKLNRKSLDSYYDGDGQVTIMRCSLLTVV